MNSKPPIVQTFESLTLPFKLLLDKDVPWKAKIVPVGLFIIYLFFPVDMIPDFLPVLGLADDLAVFTACAYLIVYMTPSIVIDKYLEQPALPASTEKTEKIINIEVSKKKKSHRSK